MAEAIAALVNATAKNARLLREMAQNNRNIPQGNHGRNNRDETTYVDFTDTHPPVFTRAYEPLEADDWLHTMEQKFDLIHCTEYQKAVFATQHLRGATRAWWANFLAAQPIDYCVTWEEFRNAFCAYFIPDGIMAMRLEEFLGLKQGDQSIMRYVGKFNHLAQYAPDHVNSNRKKKACFMRGLNSKIQTMMTSFLNATYHEAVNIAIASEEEYRKHKEAKKKKNVSSRSSSSSQKR
jgi:hypothetical protein